MLKFPKLGRIRTIGKGNSAAPPNFLLRDVFATDRTSGINGTPAEPGPGVRVVTDTYAGTELMLNGGFETLGGGGADVFANWLENNPDGVIAAETVLQHSGSRACKMVPGPLQTTYISQQIAVAPGVRYRFSGWSRGDGVEGPRFVGYDVTHSYAVLVPYTIQPNTPVWTYFEIDILIPAGCVMAEMVLGSGISGTSSYFDDVSFKPLDGLLSIQGGKASLKSNPVPGPGNPAIWYPAFDRKCGRTLYWTAFTESGNGYSYTGFDMDNFEWTNDCIGFTDIHTLMVYGDPPGSYIGNFVDGTRYRFCMVLRTPGILTLVDDGSGWKLMSIGLASAYSPVYPSISDFSCGYAVEDLRLFDLPAPWDTQYGLATQRIAGAVPLGTSFTHESDFTLEWVQTELPDPGGATWMEFNKVDDNNFWLLSVNPDGLLQLYLMLDGTPVYKAQGVTPVARGDRIRLQRNGSVISSYLNYALAISYGDVSFMGYTDGILGGFQYGVVSDIDIWPLNINGQALTTLQPFVRE